MTTLYGFDLHGGAFTGARPATAMDRDRFGALVPVGATPIAPPDAKPGECPRWADGRWEIVPDHRDQTWWTEAGIPVPVTTLGDPAGFDPPLRPGDPGRPAGPRTATGYTLYSALTREQIAKLDPKDVGRLQARGLDLIPEDNPVLARLAAQAETTVTGWFDAAAGL